MKNRSMTRIVPGVPAETIAAERSMRLKKELQKVFPDLNRSQVAGKIGVTEGTIRQWESGGDITSLPLARIAQHGGDVHYILTGEKRENRKEPKQPDPLDEISADPAKYPPGGISSRLAKLVRLQRALLASDILAGIDDQDLDVCIAALKKRHEEKAKAREVETYFQGSSQVS